ncbi:MAG: hypothetical protein RLZZ226_453 [Pseudomonadota bacterium]
MEARYPHDCRGDRRVALAVAGNAGGVKESQAYTGNAVSQPRETRKNRHEWNLPAKGDQPVAPTGMLCNKPYRLRIPTPFA